MPKRKSQRLGGNALGKGLRYGVMWPRYRDWWDHMTIKSNRVKEFERAAEYLIKHKATYQEVEKATTHDRVGVLWYHVAVLHWREAGGKFDRYLGNGQRLNQRTTIQPAGRGPFLGPDAFLRGCLDALAIDGLDKIIDWRLEKMLWYAELFNGLGYAMRGLPSPYIFGGTNIQRPGKFVRDRVFDPTVMDIQLGVAPLLSTMAQLDTTIQFVRET